MIVGGMNMKENVIECRQLTKRYRKQCALQHVDLRIAKGEIYGLIGQNGAGKSTMMKLLAGLIHPSEGEFKLFGKYPKEDRYTYRRVGVLIEEPGLYGNMNAIANMHVKALSMGCNNTEELRSILKTCRLDPDSTKKASAFSLGMKQRLGLALSLIGNPELLILDEPVNGLDPQGINDIRNTLLQLNKERNVTILLSSHILEELSKIATSYGIISKGSLIRNMSKDELEDNCKDYCRLRVDNAKAASVLLEKNKIGDGFSVTEDHEIHIFGKLDLAYMNAMLVKNGVGVCELAMHKQNLEAYFLELTKGESHD